LINDTNRENVKLQEFVKKYDFLDYYITSAKTGEGVIKAFNAIIEELYYKIKVL